MFGVKTRSDLRTARSLCHLKVLSFLTCWGHSGVFTVIVFWILTQFSFAPKNIWKQIRDEQQLKNSLQRRCHEELRLQLPEAQNKLVFNWAWHGGGLLCGSHPPSHHARIQEICHPELLVLLDGFQFGYNPVKNRFLTRLWDLDAFTASLWSLLSVDQGETFGSSQISFFKWKPFWLFLLCWESENTTSPLGWENLSLIVN